MATHSSILAWRIWVEEPGGLQSIGSQRVGHDGSDLTHTHVSLKGQLGEFTGGLVVGFLAFTAMAWVREPRSHKLQAEHPPPHKSQLSPPTSAT